jgi:hypothetical protein
LPELAIIEGNQQIATKPDESFSPSLFTFRSHFAAIHRHWYYVFMTARTFTDADRFSTAAAARIRMTLV